MGQEEEFDSNFSKTLRHKTSKEIGLFKLEGRGGRR